MYDGVYQYAYDAWNRLAKTTKAYRDPGNPSTVSLGSVVQESEYDGFGRRIVKAVKNSADFDATYHYYYYSGWRLAEIRNGSDQVLKQQVWGLTYIDELVQVALNDDPADVAEDDVESFYYAMQDAHFNVLGLVDATGSMTERYEYTPYGERTVYFSPGRYDPDAMAPTAMSRRWTAGSVAQPYGLNDVGRQGLMHDEETGLVYNRARMFYPRLGRWVQQEPLGYIAGLNLYQYNFSNTSKYVDPFGTNPQLITDIAQDIAGIISGPGDRQPPNTVIGGAIQILDEATGGAVSDAIQAVAEPIVEPVIEPIHQTIEDLGSAIVDPIIDIDPTFGLQPCKKRRHSQCQ